MNKIFIFSILGFTALYVVTVFVTAFLGYLHPFCWVSFPALAALFGAYSYIHVALCWRKFGAGTLLGFAFGLLLLVTGEGDVLTFCIMTIAGIVSDIVRKFTDRLVYAYPMLAIGVISWLLPLWTRTEWYYQGAAEELGVNYTEGLMTFSSAGGLLLVVFTTAVAGFVGIQFSAKIIKSK